jgi:hypothetical protein
VWAGADPRQAVLGLLAVGDTLTVYLNGVAQTPVKDSLSGVGTVGLGGYASNDGTSTPVGIDVTVSDFKAWRPRSEQ